MSKAQLRGLRLAGENYLNLADLLLWLSHIGEMPNLNDSQRGFVAAIIKDIRASTWDYHEHTPDE